MNTNEIEVKESPGLELAKKMLESQRQMAKELIDLYNDTNSEFRKRVEKYKKENAKRATLTTNTL